jgi:hypothetical protein
VIAQRIGMAAAFTASRYAGAVRDMPPDWFGFVCFGVVIGSIWLAFRRVDFRCSMEAHEAAERVEVEAIEAEAARAAQESVKATEADTLAKAEAAWRKASMRRAEAQRVKDEAEAAASRAQWGLKRAAEEWDSAILAAEWALKDYRDAEAAEAARKAAEAAPRDEEAIERLVSKIRALRQWTTAHGCTAAKASSAARKVAQLLDELLRRGLSTEEIKRRCAP